MFDYLSPAHVPRQVWGRSGPARAGRTLRRIRRDRSAGRTTLDGRGRVALHDGFLRSVDEHPGRPALEVGGVTLTFAELFDRAASLAATLDRTDAGDSPSLTAVLGHRSATAYSAVLAALLRGHGYVPLNPSFPAERTQSMLSRSGATAVIVDGASAASVVDVLCDVTTPLVILMPEADDVTDIAGQLPGHRLLGRPQLAAPSAWAEGGAGPDDVAYLLFTSGSTGVPKGVGVTHANVVPFVTAMAERYDIGPEDRFSQTFDLTFDLSVFDLFVAWERGARVCCPPAKALMAPGQYLRTSELTVWFSVPSLAALMTRLGMLKAGRYPALRWSLFCGEALPVAMARTWAEAAPRSVVENLYGPTEATIACTAYRWQGAGSEQDSELGLVPIGWTLPGMTAVVVDESLAEVGEGGDGELLMAGPQVAPGYWKDPERTSAAFVVPPGRSAVHYRTGDRVRRPVGDGPLRYLGRMDNQVKVHGHRVELGEIEAVVRDEAGISDVAAVGWPPTPSGVGGVVAFLGTTEADVDALRARVALRLPPYMVPRQFHVLAELPTNSNGKVDRHALRRLLQDGA